MMRLQLPFDDWPITDKAMWDQLNAGGHPVDAQGAFFKLRPASRKNLQVSYGRWLGWVSRTHPDALSVSPHKRATPERVLEWMEDLAHLRPESRLSLLEQSMRVLQKHHPDQDWSVHCRLAAIIRHEARSTPSRRKIGRIVSSCLLFEKGLKLSEVALPDQPPVSLSEARKRRDGMMIAFLALIPIRRHAFCGLELGRSIYLKSDQVFLSLDPTSTKNKTAYEAQIPPVLAAPLLTYLKFVRPWFLERGHKTHGLVWVNDHGKPYCPIHLASRISRITERLVGVRIPPHFFRDCAATTLAYDSPDAARLTRAILGHKTFGVAERHYNQARAIQAGRDYASILQTLKKDY